QGGGLAHSALHDVQQMQGQLHRLLRRHECSEGAAIAGIARLEELNRDWMYGAGDSANSWLYALQRPRPLLAEFLVNSHVLSSVMPAGRRVRTASWHFHSLRASCDLAQQSDQFHRLR
ncbi:hypothetical protein, partial [Pseudomonas aeruginosa]